MGRTLEQVKLKAFFSWQSDPAGQVNAPHIRAAIKLAAIGIGDDLDIEIVPDEATRNVSGAVNIPFTLAEKIRQADMYIADITTSHKSEDGKRNYPNSNVVFELGLAVAHLGWSRIVLLFNTHIDLLEGLPFDFDRQRISTFVVTGKSDSAGRKNLTNLVTAAMKAIIQESPKRPRELEGLDPNEMRRNRDLENLKWILSQFSLSAIDVHLERMPDSMVMSAPMMFDDFNYVYKSSSFHLNDKELARILKKFHDAWEVTVSHAGHYREASNPRLQIFGTKPPSPGESLVRAKIASALVRLKTSFSQLKAHVRDNYVEIDLDETSKYASKKFQDNWDSD